MYFQRDLQRGLVFPQQILSSPDGEFFYSPTYAEREPPNSMRCLRDAAASPQKSFAIEYVGPRTPGHDVG